MVEFGLSLPNRGVLFGATSPEEMIGLAERADRSGMFDSVWVGDGLISKPRLDSLVSLSALAARTKRVRLGVCCLASFPLRNPVQFACQWASLDVLSEGRTLLAVCLGAPTDRGGSNYQAELDTAGISAKERVPRLVEGIEVLRKVWAGPASHDGLYYKWTEIDLLPKPVQQPCPIWIASNPNPNRLSKEAYRKAVDRVGMLADGWLSTVATPADFGLRYSHIREAAERAGRASQMRSALHLMINLGDSVEDSRAEAKKFLDTYYGMNTKDETMDAWGAYGTPEHVANRIAEYIKRGLDIPILRFASFSQDAQFERGVDELLPLIREASGAQRR